MGMMRLRENNDAISSVISVALMIVVAVIIVAVIASLVLGVASDIPDAKAVAVTARVSPLTEGMADLYKSLYNTSPDPTSQYLVVTLYSDLDGTGASSRDGGTVGNLGDINLVPGHPSPNGTAIGPRPTNTTDPTPHSTSNTEFTPIDKLPEPIPAIPPATTPVYLTLMVNGTYAGGTKDPSVGESFFSEFPVIPGDCHAIVVAKFKDGSEQIILNRHF